MPRPSVLALLALLVGGCPGGQGPEDRVDDTEAQVDPRADVIDCPGAAGCEATDDLTLRGGVGVRSIVPACFESWIDHDGNFEYRQGTDEFLDCGCDRLCPEDEGWPGADEGEGDGLFRPIWVAGFQNARAAMGVRGADRGLMGEGDGLDARAIVLDQGNTRVAIVAVDGIGWMFDDVQRIREAVAAADLGVDHVVVTSSHSHSAPDSMGLYGRTLTQTGYDPEYAAQVHAAVKDAIADAVAGLTEVTLRVGSVDLNQAWDNGVANVISDLRDPWIVDPRLDVLQLRTGDATLATVVHWANHPETIADENALMTSDFIHAVRRTVTEGVTWPDETGTPGVGGVTVYWQGTVGGMMTSLHASVTDPTGAVYRDHSWEKVDTVGKLIGEQALKALATAEELPDPKLRIVARTVQLPVVNVGFQAMFSLGVFDHRPVEGYEPGSVVDPENPPLLDTEMDLLDIGPLRILTMPGEVFPECVIGGYDGGYLPPGQAITREDNPNPPKLDQAPAGPYLLDELGGAHNWILGLGNDEVGYVIPPYNFELAAAAYLDEAEGDHYEETNSLGPDTWPTLERYARELLDYANGR